MASTSSSLKLCYCDVHEHFEASIISNCGQLHLLCAQCIYLAFFEAAESGDGQKLLCPICKQTIRHCRDFNKEGVTRALLNMNTVMKNKRQTALLLPNELHAELVHFLNMESLHKMMPISRLFYAHIGQRLRRNEWAYPTATGFDKAKQRDNFVINQRGGLSVCKGNDAQAVANVVAKKPYKLDNTGAATATIRRFYFEIRVDKSTGPILFGLVAERDFALARKTWKWLEVELREDMEDLAELRAECPPDNVCHCRPHFLANDIAAWPRIDGSSTKLMDDDCLQFFAQQSLVPAAGGGDDVAEKFADGDVLGCGLLVFPEKPPPLQQQQRDEGIVAPFGTDEKALCHQLFFTKNGKLFGEPSWVSLDEDDFYAELFPFVGLVNAGTEVTGNFANSGTRPHVYDIGQHNGPIGMANAHEQQQQQDDDC